MSEEASERARMIMFYTSRGVVCGWGRAKDGAYHAPFARDAWAAWQEAQKARERCTCSEPWWATWGAPCPIHLGYDDDEDDMES